ncbi:hypothetical protein, partial [Tenacibaculum sp. L6]|uniref:hypothetical protein n=1 Tax=Tenacibaculum sp. L6 TaxID=2992764 RepID=UPI00237B73D8
NEKTDVLYIEYDNSMKIVDLKPNLSISFSIFSSKDTKINTFNFEVDNLSKNFKTLSFDEMKDTISFKNKNNFSTLKKFSKITPCELHYKLSDAQKIYLIKKSNNVFFKYRLNYIGTQRGWEKIE